MSKKLPKLYLQDILTSIERIAEYVDNLTFETFENDQKTVDAVIRNLEIIGEAARNIPESLTEKYPDVPWPEMVSMRNKVIHEYSGVDVETLWKTIQEDLSALKEQVEKISDD